MGIAFLKSRFIKSPEHIGNYIEYLEKQNPLFSQFGELELAEALEDALYPSNSIAWDQIFSITAEDATRLNIDREYMKNLLNTQKHRIAAAYNISPSNLRIIASFHDVDHHPHIHMLIYSTDRREGYVKVHKNASKEEILNRASEKLKSILTNAIFHDERISIKKEKSSKRDALRQSLEKAINVKSEIQNQLATLAKDLAAFSGRKTAYGYLPPQLKQSVDKLLENIVTHDATCIMAYESYAASHRALLQHYAKRPEVLEEKMSEWRHDFFHPIKGGDTTRHNLILKAALSLSPSLEVEPDTKKYFQVNPARPHSEDTARKTAAEYLYGSHKVPATKGYAALESLSKSKTGSTSSWALYYMAKMKLYGIGTTRNYEEALRLFAQSQQAGNEYAEQALRTARQEHIVYHAKSALAITRTLIRQLAQNMSQTTTQNHTMGLTRHQKLRRAMKHKKELHEPLYP